MYLTKNGILRKGTSMYIEMEACKVCGEPYLTKKYNVSAFCGFSCARSGKNNPFFGKTHPPEVMNKISKNRPSVKGFLNPNWKGGIKALGLAGYETYKNKLSLYEDIRKQSNTEILEARCAYCGRWFAPKCSEVQSRLKVVNKLSQGEGRLYCSDDCKQACPTYGRQKHPRGFKKATSREVSTYLRQTCFERDDWECQICGKTIKDIQLHCHHINGYAQCGKTIKDIQLHCHHINGYAQNKILANDIDNVITLCKECHKRVHKLPGCRYVDLRCEER
jgi:5-methylcytosine-specific restriction endonuclease McrA